MTFVLEIPDDEVMAPKAKAQARGISAEQYARHVLKQDLTQTDPTPSDSRPISEVIAEIMADTPQEELAKLPKDGSSEHDHYLYGWPKRND